MVKLREAHGLESHPTDWGSQDPWVQGGWFIHYTTTGPVNASNICALLFILLYLLGWYQSRLKIRLLWNTGAKFELGAGPVLHFSHAYFFPCVSVSLWILLEIFGVPRFSAQHSQEIYRPEICATGKLDTGLQVWGISETRDRKLSLKYAIADCPCKGKSI